MEDGGSVDGFLTAAEQLLVPVDAFFENVFVMNEDLAVRQNRLALLRYAPSQSCCNLQEFTNPPSSNLARMGLALPTSNT